MHNITRTTALAAIALLAMIPACASTPATSTPANTTSASADVLTAAEIDQRHLGDRNLLDIVRLVRSQCLNLHGTAGSTAGPGGVQVAIGSAPLSSLGSLANIQGRDVLEMDCLSAPSAAQRYGSSANNGAVIVVRTK